MQTFVVIALSLLWGGCATLNTAGMAPRCRELYNACLNQCPQAPTPPPGALLDMHLDTASCTKACNDQATSCR